MSENQLRTISSWIEEYTGGAEVSSAEVDTVRVGYYLSEDGTLTESYTATSMALVVETDGSHGKAVALSDVAGEWVFSSKGTSTGLSCQTLDGRAREGSLLRSRAVEDSVSFVFYSDTIPFPQNCAFSRTDGFELCSGLHLQYKERGYPLSDMQGIYSLSEGSYVPSAGEMASLYYLLNGYRGENLKGTRLNVPDGAYLTSSESSDDTCYSIDFTHGAITGNTSKRYTPLRVRLFYLF